MGVFSNNAITDNGRLLLGQVQMGAVFTPTKIVMGSGYMPAGSTPRSMTSVVKVEQTLEISKKKMANDGTVTIGGVYSNEDVTTGFYFRELAIYAKAVKEDGTEIPEVLYSYGNAGENADYMPAYTTGQAVERQIDVVTYIGNDTQVDLTIDSNVWATKKEVQELRDDVDEALEKATAAQSAADAAEEKAGSAVSTAEAAQSAAEEANQNATTALNTANDAKTAAEGAASAASKAMETANTAKDTADTAKSTADTAKTTADNALEATENLDMVDEGMVNRTTTFNADGSITEVYGDRKRVTTFDSDTQITEKLYENEVLKKTKVTTFNGDVITEEVS